MVLGSSPVAVTSPSNFVSASSKEFLDIQATIECGFTLKRVRDMTRTYSQDLSIIIQSRKTLLFHNSEPWVKKLGNENFDVHMGCYDGAELYELVGSFILNKLTSIVNNII